MVSKFHNKTLVVGLMWALFIPDVGFAASTDEEGMQVGGDVPDVCQLAAPLNNGLGINAEFRATGNENSQVTILSLADENTGVLNPASISLDFIGTCNFAHSLILSSAAGGLRHETSLPTTPGFLTLASYVTTVTWNGHSRALTLSGQSGASTTAAQIGANSGVLTLDVNIPGGGLPLVAGQYSDVLTIEFGGTL